ncbi:hypothetical protein [Micromonospora sp. ATA51]|uniref:hypothetical protein n=1 Tax=Micromonospora sp. ATA51 TaxID=2806098 RepID=UPI0028152192|nr:hypothetical protein [Micromonospora sp. ATA51]
MTSPAEPASTDAPQASQLTKPLRELAALVLLGANAVLLVVGLFRLLVPMDDYSTFSGRAGSTFFVFVGVESTVLPVLAVLLATHVRPVLPKAKLITQVALGEYALGALFGALTFLIWLVGRLAEAEVLDALLGLLTRAAWLAIFAVAGYVVFKVWRTLYYTPRPKPQPGVYGQPQPGWPQPGAHPGQPGGYPSPGQGGYPPAGGYPAPNQPGYPAANQPAYPAANQPGGYPPPGQFGQPNPSRRRSTRPRRTATPRTRPRRPAPRTPRRRSASRRRPTRRRPSRGSPLSSASRPGPTATTPSASTGTTPTSRADPPPAPGGRSRVPPPRRVACPAARPLFSLRRAPGAAVRRAGPGVRSGRSGSAHRLGGWLIAPTPPRPRRACSGRCAGPRPGGRWTSTRRRRC